MRGREPRAYSSASLEPITRAAIRIVEATAGRTAADLRGEGVDLAAPEQRAV